MELSDVKSLDQYPEDEINFSKQYWIDMLKIYGPNNRQFLGRDTALFLLLKLTLQNLAQTRLLRVSSTTTFSNIQNKLDTLSFSVDSPAHKNQVLAAIKRTHTMLDTAQKHRIKSMKDYGIKHSTLIEACSSNSNSQNPQGTSSNINSNHQGSGHSNDYEDNYWNGD